MKLTNEEAAEILKNEKEIFNGDRRAACAAHVHTPGVVMKVGYKEPPFSNRRLITDLVNQVTAFENERSVKRIARRTARKTPSKKPKNNQAAATGASDQTAAAEQTGDDQTATGDKKKEKKPTAKEASK
jgi:hypothetical protein